MNKIFIGDNSYYFNKEEYFQDKFKIIYMDPPYNTGNQFKYNDKATKENWENDISKKIVEVKKYMSENSVFIASISEESLFSLHKILKESFKNVFEPLIWLTKNPLNQNKVTNISSICHEYILIASDYDIKSNMEIINIEDNLDSDIVQNKIERYKTSINLHKDISEFKTIIVNNKEIVVIPKDEYSILNNKEKGFKGHRYQKRTAQNGHGAKRYVDLIQTIDGFSEDNLYFIKGVKDKYSLGGKFIKGNNYFQTINNEIQLKIPSFLGFYSSGVSNFQTAKPIELIQRIFKAFSNKNDFVLDMYGGSGNVALATHSINRFFYTFEWGTIEEFKKNRQGDFILSRLSQIENIEIIK